MFNVGDKVVHKKSGREYTVLCVNHPYGKFKLMGVFGYHKDTRKFWGIINNYYLLTHNTLSTSDKKYRVVRVKNLNDSDPSLFNSIEEAEEEANKRASKARLNSTFKVVEETPITTFKTVSKVVRLDDKRTGPNKL